MKHKDPASALMDCLQKEKKCFDALLGKLNEQLEAIQKDDEARLTAIIAEKDQLLAGREDSEEEMKKIVSGLTPKALGEAEQKTGELGKQVEAVLEKIIELENACQVELQARKFLVQDKIFDLKQGRTLLKGYGTTPRIKPKISKNV